MKRSTLIYIAGWLIYIVFSYMAFPTLGVTVLLVSIPLTMLGGWLFRHRGAFLTTLLTIPYHFCLLHCNPEPVSLALGALNPFGIISQLLFSHSTAFLRTTREQQIRLHSSLEEIVAERTREMEELTHHLIEMEDREYSDILEILLETPLNQLRAMRGIIRILVAHLESIHHDRLEHAMDIASAVDSCIDDIQAMEASSQPKDLPQPRLEELIRSFTRPLMKMSNVQLDISSNEECEPFFGAQCEQLGHIVFQAVSNALQHAQPTHIRIGITQSDTACTISIENNGIPLPETIEEGLGIPIMHYRASKLGATLSVRSMPNKNTRVECAIPRLESTCETILPSAPKNS